MTWESRRLGELVEFKVGKTPARAERRYWNGTHPWLSIKDMNQGLEIAETKEYISDLAVSKTKPFLVPAGTVLLSFKLSVGKVGIARRPLFTNEAIAALVPRRGALLDPRYLLRALQYVDIASGGNDAVLGVTLNRAGLEQIRIPVPPVPEQRRIAGILDEADALRTRTADRLSKLSDLTRAQHRQVFAATAPTETLDSLLTRIESGVSPVCESRPAAGDEWGVLKLGAVTTGEFLPNENKAITATYEPRTELAVRAGDVLLSRKNTLEHVGASVYVSQTQERRLLPDLVFRLVPRDRAVSRAMQAYLSLPATRKELSNLAGGSANSMANISKARLLTLPMPRISPAMIEAIDAISIATETARASAGVACAASRSLFASLQHRAFRGEL